MRLRVALLGVVALLAGGSARGQAANPADQRMDRFEQRLNEMEKKYQAELKARDEEIARLRAQVEKQQQSQASAAGPTTKTSDIDIITQEILKDVESRTPFTRPATVRTPASFNPDLAVIGDWRGNIATHSDNPARNRLDLGSVELDLRAAVDPRADAVVILPVSRDVEDPLFFDPAKANGEIDTSIDIEEAYLFLHDFGVENLTAKLGRFHLRFGRWNQLHSHNWMTIDNAFPVQSFMGPEALEDSGVSLSYIVPPKLIGGEYVELVTEIISGEGSDEAPVLNNDAFVQSPALNMHLLWNHDINKEWNMELGASWLWGKHNDKASEDAQLFGLDATLVHTDPTGRFNNQFFMAELFYGNVDTAPNQTQYALGAYVLGQQQLNRDWYVGTRLDWTQDALNDRQEIWGVAPYVSWYWSEFLRLRLEYQHRDGDVQDEDILWFQANFTFGAHPPHPYWGMR